MRSKEIWLFISILGLLIFNWPFLEIFRTGVVVYLFAIWAVFIILAGIIAGRDKDEKKGA